MTASDQLFDLVHSLTKEQKRQFRIYAQKYDRGSKYLTLFELLSKRKEYDSAAIKEEWYKLHPESRLAISKEYLMELILKSIRDAVPTSPEQTVLQLLQDIQNLLDRRLYSAAKKRIAKVEQIAREHDLVGEKLIAVGLESYLPDKNREEIFEKEKHIVREIEQIFELGVFAESFRTFSEEKGRVRSEEDRNTVQQLLDACSFPDPNTHTTFSARLQYNFALFKYHELKGNIDGVFEYHHKIIDLYDEYPAHIGTHQLEYISIVLNLCNLELYYGDRNKIPCYLDRLLKLEVGGQVRPYFELMMFHFHLRSALVSRDWCEIDRLHCELDNLLARNAEANSFGKDIRIDLYLLFVQAYFLREEFDRALLELNKLFELSSLKEHAFQADTARILLLLTHYELDNASYLPYLIRSTYRNFLRRESLHPFESTILKFLSSLTKITTVRSLKQRLNQLSKEMQDRCSDIPEFPWKQFYLDWIERTVASFETREK